MANSFQSRAKPFIFYQEAAEAQVKLAKLEREKKRWGGQGSSCGNSNLQPRTRKRAETLRRSAQRLPRSWQRKCRAHVINQHTNANKWIWSPLCREEVRLPRPSRPPKKVPRCQSSTRDQLTSDEHVLESLISTSASTFLGVIMLEVLKAHCVWDLVASNGKMVFSHVPHGLTYFYTSCDVRVE